MKNVSIKFLGAASTVTGSKYLLQTPNFNVMIDCGLFQGLKELRLKNWDHLPLDPGKIDAVIITHAHLDHTGYLPVLVKNGFNGNIYLSKPTAEITEIILKDSAKLQKEDADLANEKGFSKHKPAKPLYDEDDVYPVLGQFVRMDELDWVELNEHIRFRFVYNGHILGACFVEIDCYGKKIIFSGDIGTNNSITLHDPKRPEIADYVVIESTYGDRNHSSISPLIALRDIVNDSIRRGGNLLIPSFAVGRAQELMVLLKELKSSNQIPDIPVFLDTPMGVNTTKVYCNYPGWHKLSEKDCHYFFEDIQIVKDIKHTYKIIESRFPKIVIAASGMLTGGRVLHYLKEWLPSRKNTVLLVGYQAEGTRGRAIKSGSSEVKIFGEFIPVNCNVEEVNSLSAHADQNELLAWVGNLKNKPDKLFIVHGDPSSSHAFKLKLESKLGISSITPHLNQEEVLFNL